MLLKKVALVSLMGVALVASSTIATAQHQRLQSDVTLENASPGQNGFRDDANANGERI